MEAVLRWRSRARGSNGRRLAGVEARQEDSVRLQGRPRGSFLLGQTFLGSEARGLGPESKGQEYSTCFQIAVGGDLRDSGPGTHPSVEAVTRATLLASGSRRAIPELAIRTDFHARVQQFSSSTAFCMAARTLQGSAPPRIGDP